ncbi:MAG: lamin tail domain-containing protein, partial [Thermoplasmata archaeon]
EDSIPGYNDDWTREDTPTFGAQNDVPPINKTSFVILNEVMFNPINDPEGKYIVIMNKDPFWTVNISNFYLVCDDVYQLPSYPLVPGGFDGILFPNWNLIIRFADDSPASDPFFTGMTPSGDNVYLYDSAGHLLDMVGWNTSHIPGMCVRRVPDGNGTYQGYNDPTSEAAGWVFNSPLQVLITEVSDSGTSPSQIEVYNPWYPMIDFINAGFTLSSSSGLLSGTWSILTADSGEYAVFDVNAGTPLDTEGDIIRLNQNNVFVEEISYGLKGTVPDPLAGESVQRYWDGTLYTDVWERNYTTGPNFGAQNDVPPANFNSALLLNEIMFYPVAPADYFVEVYNMGATPVDISGYRIVCDRDYVIPGGTILDFDNRFFYLLYAMDPSFFNEPNGISSTGDNVYLYDNNGRLLDMVGWSSQHEQGKTMSRVPDGNGTRDGYDDASSIAAGWVFNHGQPPMPTPPPPTGLQAELTGSNNNVTLTWNASSDDGGGEDDVAGYTVYKSITGVNGSYEFASWIPESSSAKYNWTDVGAGDGDWNNYFYLVRANDTSNIEEQNLNKVGKFVNYLVEGWNVFSVPLIQVDTSMGNALQTIKGNFVVLQGYHAGKSRPWLHWHRDKPNKFNDAIDIKHNNGYYIDSVIPDYIVVVGVVPTNTQIPLKAGWNLVGYPCLIEKTRDVALSSIAGKYNKVEYYDTVIHKEVRLEPDDLIQPGLGYWIHATEDCVLIL